MKDSLGDRMKGNYEDRFRTFLPRRTNIIIRIDGKAFHSYTKGLQRPYDMPLMEDMNETTKYLCENIQGAKMGYVQSDEISILMTDYDDISTHAWFDNNLQKMCSIAASMATAKFNQLRTVRAYKNSAIVMEAKDFSKIKLATFDARVFIIPESEEVVNYFIWRQQDATRNSISMSAQSMFSHKQLHGKSTNQMQDMMMLEKEVNWNNYPTRFKRGSAFIKTEIQSLAKDFKFSNKKGTDDLHATVPIDPERIITRRGWSEIDTPIFSQDRDFVKTTFLKKSEEISTTEAHV